MRKLVTTCSVLLALGAFTAPSAQALPICNWMPLFCDNQPENPTIQRSTGGITTIQVNPQGNPTIRRSTGGVTTIQVNRQDNPTSQRSTGGVTTIQVNRPGSPSGQRSTTERSSVQ